MPGRYALQTPHTLINARVVREMHARGIAVHAILSPFLLLSSGIDRDTGGARLRRELERLVLAEVDGVMTDYPKRVLPMLRELQVRANAGVLAPTAVAAPGA